MVDGAPPAGQSDIALSDNPTQTAPECPATKREFLDSEKDPRPSASSSRLAALNMLVFAPIGVQLPFLPLWYASVGLGADAIALIQGATPIARFLSNLLVPPLADRHGGAARLLALCALAMTLGSLAAGFAQPAFWPIFVFIVVSAFGQGPMIALADSIVLREARRRVLAGERPLDYGVVRGAGSFSVLALMATGGWFVGLFPAPTIVFVIAGVMAAIVPAIYLLTPGEPADAQGARAMPRESVATPGLVALIVIGAALIQASHALVYTFGSIAFRDMGHGNGVIGLLWAIGVATEIVFFVVSNRFGGASRAYGLLIAGGVFAALRWLLMSFATSTPLLFFGQALHAVSFASTHLGAVYALTRLVGETRRAQAQGWISGANALSTAAAATICGPLWKNFGLHAYFAMAMIATVGLALVIRAALDPRKDS